MPLARVHVHFRSLKWTPARSQVLKEKECPWDSDTCLCAFYHEHWDCFQYLVDNDCLGWEIYAEKYAKHLVLSHAYYKFWDCLKYAVDNKCPGWEYYAKNYAKHLR